MALSTEFAGIHPTRLELLRLRRRRTLAEGIIDILKKDLEALIITLFEFLKQIPSIRDQIYQVLNEAYGAFIEAEMITGSKKIEELSLVAQPIDFNIITGTQTGILGILFPSFELAQGTGGTLKPRYSILDSPASLVESASRIRNALNYIIKLAETEAYIREILDVISIKKRQINRLEYRILPELDTSIRYIELILEETERQDAIRVRVLQRKRKERSLKLS